MKTLTRGFDLLAELSEDVCEYIFRMAYWSDLPTGIPNFVSATNAGDPADIVEIYFNVPSLKFVTVGQLQNTVRIDFAFTARVFPETREARGVISVIMAATIPSGGEKVIVVDFVSAPDQFKVSDAFAHDLAIIESRVRPLLVKTLFQKLKGRPISPPVSATVPFFTFRTYFVPTPENQQNKNVRLLGVFVNRQNSPAPPPNSVEAWVHNDIYRPLKPKGGLAIAIPVEIVMPIMQQSLANQGFATVNLPKTSPTDATVTINSLSFSLERGFIFVKGNATKEIDVLPDPDIDFEIWIGLWIQNGALEVEVLHVNADLPWWLSLVHFILPFVGTVILDVVRKTVLESISKSVGGVAQGAVSEIAAFGSDLPNAGGLVKIENTGRISIRPEGLIIPGRAETIFNARAIKEPTYIFGNYETKEFHKADCKYFLMMKSTKRIPFINPLHALRSGHNGCAWCYPEFNNPNPGRVVFKLFDPNHDTNFLGSIEGQRTDPVTIGGLNIIATINIHSNFAIAGTHKWWQILTGEWRFTFKTSEGDWMAECVVQVPLEDPDGTLYITATRGKATCNHAIGNAPGFP